MKPTLKPKKSKSLKKLKQECWELCKQITRARCIAKNGVLKCYTCGRLIDEPKKAHTGHCLPSGSCGALLRHHLDNLRVQDYYCNINLGGNGAIFITNLRAEIGDERVDAMLALRNKTVKADSIFYQNLIHSYQSLLGG